MSQEYVIGEDIEQEDVLELINILETTVDELSGITDKSDYVEAKKNILKLANDKFHDEDELKFKRSETYNGFYYNICEYLEKALVKEDYRENPEGILITHNKIVIGCSTENSNTIFETTIEHEYDTDQELKLNTIRAQLENIANFFKDEPPMFNASILRDENTMRPNPKDHIVIRKTRTQTIQISLEEYAED